MNKNKLMFDISEILIQIKNGYLSGQQSKEAFLRSGLSNDILGNIFKLCDLDHDGNLDLPEFSIGMHLINHVRGGSTLPREVPDSLLKQFGVTMRLIKDSNTNYANEVRLQEQIRHQQDELKKTR